ncbi:nucleotidyltransferase domain-containing protein [Flavobacterium sp. Fl-318]|uniref:Nucleotidyltransferase domain-containing protein n=1 Tax=Flavobacterium cupriresistens TaxID=2893885 RepID=A0ABU4RBJ0_9FLAO|nr:MULTISPECIES: nucleotidyltransferase domain-containing protein [unclassified Flavobacterium]MDX6187891.1 nucleotidyltransferase domain-containing protein [Flavobacterium sp. Fl-318]UFH42189.1 nucleotidyltransferase domain-containing protein [Flavobacterium sp. F-323]
MTIQDLKSQNLILFEVISGSKSFGLNTPASDTDIKGVYYVPKEKFFGLEYIPQIANETNDEVYYEIGRFVELLLKNNPNILEILATPEDCILYKHPLMDCLKIEDFLSKLCKDSFAGYAVSQIKKARGLNKKIVNPMPKEKKSLLDFCYILKGYETISLTAYLTENNLNQEQCGLVNLPNSKGMFALFYDADSTLAYKGIIQKETSNDVSLSSVPKGQKSIAYLSCNQDGYSKYCKEYTDYWSWIEKRNEDRYNTNQQHGKNYDSKNMMHTIRLLQTAEQIGSTGKLNIKVNNREELLDIKAGNRAYDDLLQMADDLIVSIESYYRTSAIQEAPDEEKVIRTLIRIREELYR